MDALRADVLDVIRQSMLATRKARLQHFPNEPHLYDSALEDYARNAAMSVLSVVLDLLTGEEG